MFLEELLAVGLRARGLHTPRSNGTQPFHWSQLPYHRISAISKETGWHNRLGLNAHPAILQRVSFRSVS